MNNIISTKKFKIALGAIIFLCVIISFMGCDKQKTSEQATSKVLMIEPTNFGYNEQTASSNAFQQKSQISNPSQVAIEESHKYVDLLKSNGINVVYVKDTDDPKTPDAVFPNNWFSTHDDGTLVLYPMSAQNRREERKSTVLDAIYQNFNVKKTVDLTHWETQGEFLEGTGSMVLDRQNKIVYACRSPRTSEKVLNDFCNQLGYTSVVFDAVDQNNKQIYHTNVLMAIGSDFSLICKDSIKDEAQQKTVVDSLSKNGKSPIFISFDQMNKFAGNMLEVKNKDGKHFLVMSDTAFNCLSDEQKSSLSKSNELLHTNLETIENEGGGSSRCMLAEIF